ncbi:MAG TPA: YebC/PmpR family DNA-binding transcriptional regulator [Chloroflexi bacterium]|nr:YebC/PmpR family DNA-binding transcriptional regulator [Chloroflexota bacterium]
MSGHSKWSTIKRKKASNDAKRGKLFTRMAREIAIAAREGGGDPEMNFSLRIAIDKAKESNMPKDNIKRAIKRGTGELKGGELVEEVYEGYAPNGVGLLIQVLTDNKNRTVADIRRVLSSQGGNIAEAGAVAWQFERKGYIAIETDANDVDEMTLFDVAVEAGAEDVIFGDDMIEIFVTPSNLQAVKQALEDADIQTETVELSMVPNATIELSSKETFKVMRVIDELEDLDDTQHVFSNLDISDDVMTQYEAASGA